MSGNFYYDGSGNTVGTELLSADRSTGSAVCKTFDARGRPSTASVSAIVDGAVGGTPMSTEFTYSQDSLTATSTFTVDGETLTAETTTDLIGRTVSTTDVWGVTVTTDYTAAPSTGVQTITETTTAGTYETTSTTTTNRDGTPATVSRADNTAGSAKSDVTYTYDAHGRVHMIAVKSGATDIATMTYGYDAVSGQVTSTTWTKDATTFLTDTLAVAPNSGRTLGETFVVSGTTPATYSYSYSFNDAGWLAGTTLASSDGSYAGAWDFTYASSTLGTNPDAYLNGNVSKRSASVTTPSGTDNTETSYGYDFADRLTATSEDPTGSNIDHDPLGNLTTYGDLTLTYNEANQVTDLADSTARVTFDRLPDGSVYRKSTSTPNGNTTELRYASNGLFLDASGAPTTQVMVFGNLVAMVDVATPADSAYRVTTLQTGTHLLDLDSTGTVGSAIQLFGPWGEPLTSSSAPTVDPQYGWQAASLLEQNVGAIQMGRRVFLPEIGRFTSIDPRPGGSLNPYNYANKQPFNSNDPSGAASTVAIAGIAGGATFAMATATWISLAFTASMQGAANPVAQPVVPRQQVEGQAEGIEAEQEEGAADGGDAGGNQVVDTPGGPAAGDAALDGAADGPEGLPGLADGAAEAPGYVAPPAVMNGADAGGLQILETAGAEEAGEVAADVGADAGADVAIEVVVEIVTAFL